MLLLLQNENTLKIREIGVIRENPRFAAYSTKCDLHSDGNNIYPKNPMKLGFTAPLMAYNEMYCLRALVFENVRVRFVQPNLRAQGVSTRATFI